LAFASSGSIVRLGSFEAFLNQVKLRFRRLDAALYSIGVHPRLSAAEKCFLLAADERR
jgi:hypothetical protein